MIDRASQIIQEIQQIKDQYVAEVGTGRRAWPRSIKDRAGQLDDLGVPAKGVARQTGISYDTLILWRYKRRHAIGRFHEVKVEAIRALSALPAARSNAEAILKPGTVTVPNFEMPPAPAVAVVNGLRLTTPGGFVIEGLDAASVALLIGNLSQTGGGHAT